MSQRSPPPAAILATAAMAWFTTETRAMAGGPSRFEPTDLEMETPGALDFDLQIGWGKAETGYRAFVPDIELDLGILPRLEFDVDWAFFAEDADANPFAAGRTNADNLWLATKLLVLRPDDEKSSFGLALQLGPKIAVGRGARGVGYEAVALFGRSFGPLRLVWNVGGLVDPGSSIAHGRPAGIEGGIDLTYTLGAAGQYAIVSELGAVHFFSDDADQVHPAIGVQWSPNDQIDLSAVALMGLLGGGERGGMLIGVSPKCNLW